MNALSRVPVIVLIGMLPFLSPGIAQPAAVAPLPAGVSAVWDLGRAYRETTATKERICINGLWRWQPAAREDETVPATAWGFFKVPGSWPGITDYMQKDAQAVFAHESWKDQRLRELEAAWYQREISVPAEWSGRRIALSAAYVNSVATVWIDGVKRGEIRFPGGELDLTAACRPGATHLLSLRVEALPLKSVLLSYTDSNAAREVRGRVARRGLCGDLFLTGTPAAARIADVKVSPSFREQSITLDVALAGLAVGRRYTLEARVTRAGQPVKTFVSQPFGPADLAAGRFAFAEHWLPDALWDVHTPQNTYDVACALMEAEGRVADADFTVRFGFREFWIEGRDFMLNGTPIHLRVVPLDNAQVSAALAGYAGARESLERLKGMGINFVYTHNYGCEPGSHLGFEEILRAADDVGMLVSFSQPHFSHYDWKATEADRTNGYAAHAEYYVRATQNHPSVVAYAMNHNATGYTADMNPDLIDGIQDPREARAQVNAKLALRAEALVRQWDATRVIYHHSSGNLGSMHTSNFYPNFAPAQELSDWFGHWATKGVKPVFLCEYGAPFTWDWTMYRGWYKGERAFGSARVPWEFCLAEWNAQFIGDPAFQISRREAENLRWEAKQLAAGRVWHRWDYPHQVGSRDFDERFPVFAHYVADNWPAYRTWGLSAISPWEYGHYWKPREGVDRRRQEFPVDWASLQRPGWSADFIDGRYERIDLAFDRDDWIPTVAAQALLRYNQPLLGYIAGKTTAFTSKDHLFTAGEVVEKQLVVINDARTRVTGEVRWSVDLPGVSAGTLRFAVAAGRQERLPLRIALPAAVPPGEYVLNAEFRFDGGETQHDRFRLHVIAPARATRVAGRIALFDPRGETGALLQRLGVRGEPVDASADLSGFALLIVGKGALQPGTPAPDIARVRDGLKVVVFEQEAATIERRFGFRVAEYGLRRAFPRVPDHPVLAGVGAEALRDWRGEATLLPARLETVMDRRLGSTVQWCDITVTRLWRGGNRGNVASVLIEKPARGDFLPLVDGGYSLQYSPLLEHRVGRGVVVFCQLDLTGRTEADPAADRIAQNLLGYVSSWQPGPVRKAVYAGEPAGKAHLEAAGITVGAYRGGPLDRDTVLVLGPGAAGEVGASRRAIAAFVEAGGRVAALGLEQAEVEAVLPVAVRIASQEHVATFFAAGGVGTPFAGIGPSDVHNRAPQPLPLVRSGAEVLGNGVLASGANGAVAFCQLLPWRFDPAKQSNLKRTFRRTAFTVARLLANQGVAGDTPVLERFRTPWLSSKPEQRWRDGLYLDQPEEWDDPYRFFRW